MRPFGHAAIQPVMCPISHSSIHPLIHPFVHSSIHPSIHSSSIPPTHPFIHSINETNNRRTKKTTTQWRLEWHTCGSQNCSSRPFLSYGHLIVSNSFPCATRTGWYWVCFCVCHSGIVHAIQVIFSSSWFIRAELLAWVWSWYGVIFQDGNPPPIQFQNQGYQV